MPLLLRIVTKWHWSPSAGEEKRPDDEVAAEDFDDPDHEVSVWVVDDERSNLNRILAALAGSRDFLVDVLDFVLFDSTLATNLGIQISAGDGATRDAYANGAWHRNLINPSRGQILALVRAIKAAKPNAPAERLKGKTDLLPLVKHSVQNGWMNRAELSPHLQSKLD